MRIANWTARCAWLGALSAVALWGPAAFAETAGYTISDGDDSGVADLAYYGDGGKSDDERSGDPGGRRPGEAMPFGPIQALNCNRLPESLVGLDFRQGPQVLLHPRESRDLGLADVAKIDMRPGVIGDGLAVPDTQ